MLGQVRAEHGRVHSRAGQAQGRGRFDWVGSGVKSGSVGLDGVGRVG